MTAMDGDEDEAGGFPENNTPAAEPETEAVTDTETETETEAPYSSAATNLVAQTPPSESSAHFSPLTQAPQPLPLPLPLMNMSHNADPTNDGAVDDDVGNANANANANDNTIRTNDDSHLQEECEVPVSKNSDADDYDCNEPQMIGEADIDVDTVTVTDTNIDAVEAADTSPLKNDNFFPFSILREDFIMTNDEHNEEEVNRESLHTTELKELELEQGGNNNNDDDEDHHACIHNDDMLGEIQNAEEEEVDMQKVVMRPDSATSAKSAPDEGSEMFLPQILEKEPAHSNSDEIMLEQTRPSESGLNDPSVVMEQHGHGYGHGEEESSSAAVAAAAAAVFDPIASLREAEAAATAANGTDRQEDSSRRHVSRSRRHGRQRLHFGKKRQTNRRNTGSSRSRASASSRRQGMKNSNEGGGGEKMKKSHLNHMPYQHDKDPQSMPHRAYKTKDSRVITTHEDFDTTMLHLPMDAMHCISTYWTVKDLNHFGLVNRHTSVICQNIIRRVKMHAFKCAVEVATTWNRGEHADAKELAALYVHSGVPIYPAPLGHAYHTLHWRMKVEANSMKETDEDDADDNHNDNDDGAEGDAQHNDGIDHMAVNDVRGNENDGIMPHRRSLFGMGSSVKYKHIEMRNGFMDRFYLERADARNAGGYWIASLTYLEEKGLFWKSKVCGAPTQWTREQRLSRRQTFNIRPPPPPIADTFGFLGFMDEEEDLPNLSEQNRIIGIGENVEIGPGDTEFGHIPEIAAMRESDANFSANSRNSVNSRLEDIPNLNEQEEEWRRSLRSSAKNGSSLRAKEEEEEANAKILLHCHKHLVDRHLQGLPAISDELGNMNAGSLQLGADFFHPVLNRSYPFKCNFGTYRSSILDRERRGSDGYHGGNGFGYSRGSIPRSGYRQSQHRTSSSSRRDSTNSANSARRPFIIRSSLNARPPSRRSERGGTTEHGGLGLDSSTLTNSASLGSMLSTIYQEHQYVDHCVIADLDLRLYDSTSGDDYDIARRRRSSKQYLMSKKPFVPKISTSDVRTIVPNYERKLHALLQRGDYSGYEECLLDFWDEFFSLTSHVHFFDQHTPVPRMSKLHHFLTKPCPKAFGTMQCEIERIRVKYRTKGMMTGRYYSTYEYRLFIKDRRQDVAQGSHPRMDTMLMAAKYRGKHYSGPNGLAPVTTGKKGVNHYFLYMPHQSDMDEHYALVNQKDDKDSDDAKKKKKKKKNRKGDDDEDQDGLRRYRQEVPAGGSILELCRLQTNHMGTEFQISSPCALKYNNGGGVESSEDDHHVAGDDANDRMWEENQTEAEDSSPLNTSSTTSKFNPFKKSSKGQKNKNINSRIAARISPWSKKMSLTNNPKTTSVRKSDGEIQPHFIEEREIGAITYTANVLGNRPRIMNVCIPKVSSETERPVAADDAWTKSPGEDGMMLSKLKDIQHFFHPNEEDPHQQQHQQNNQHHDNNNNNNNDNPADTDDTNQDDHGLTSLQNRPPWWNNELGAFVLNFGGRVSVASVKNFQLCDRDDHNDTMLQFGRIEGRHSFTMDFSFPLSPAQAFAISISSLQSKISFA